MAKSVILCVDADTEQLKQVSQMIYELELPDFFTIPATSGQAALEQLQELKTSGAELALVISASNVPGLPISEMLTHIRREHPYVQVILLSLPNEDEGRRKKGLNVPGHFIRLQKPVEATEMLGAIRDSLLEWTRIRQSMQAAQPLHVLNDLFRTLREMSVLNSFDHSFLSVCLRETQARLGAVFQRAGDGVKILSLLAEDMDENMGLQRELQQSPDALAQRLQNLLIGVKAEMPTRIVLPVNISGENTGILFLERAEDAPCFTPWQREVARTLAYFLGELETGRIMRSRLGQDRRELELAKREQAELRQLAAIQHQSLDQSIKYARLTAAATMPEPDALNRMYEDAFMVFRPRDVVSGCFYWFGERYYKFMVALADTRVPGIGGAFLSLLFHRLIDEVTNKTALPKPRNLLLDLNERIKRTFRDVPAVGAGALQGLRIGLVGIDESVQVLRYAGADMPLWLVRDGEVKRLNSGTVPLGLEPFPGHKLEIKQHTLQLSEDDRVYVTTPGLLELRGGHDYSPLGAERFRQILQEASMAPFREQPRIFNTAIDSWLDGRQASHDILLCGLKTSA